MTHQDANKLLDMRREGMDMPQQVVDEALAITEDLAMVEPPSPSLELYVQNLRDRGLL
jgi:hypothetical protein